MKPRPFLSVLLAILILPIISHAQSKVEKIDELVNKYNEYRLFNGAVLVSEGGNVIYKKGIGYANFEWNIPNTPDTKFRLGSITKQFTATLIMQLVEIGKINLNQKITDILPEYPARTGDKITIHHLLTHTSGIPNYTDIPGFMGGAGVRTTYTTDELVKLFSEKDLDFEPGSKWSYSNSGYLLLGAIIEKVTGDTYENILKKYILDPADMNDTGYDHFETVISKRATGYDRTATGFRNSRFIDMTVPFSAGSMYSTVEDLFKWDQILLTDKLLSEENKLKMFTGHILAFGNQAYGYGWLLKKLPRNANGDSVNVITHGGGIFGFNTMIMREPEQNNVVVLLNNTPGANLDQMAASISNILFDLPYEMPKQHAIDIFARTLAKRDINEAIALYKKLKVENEKDYIFREENLNELGYELLRSNKTEDALAVFKLAVDDYPNSWNVYDSYGECLLASGDTVKAIANYKLSLEKNPANEGALNVLKRLGIKYKKQDVNVSPEILMMYTGQYQLAPDFVITISTEKDRIFAQATGQPRFEIYPKTESDFYMTVVNAQLNFVKGDQGKVTHLILHQNGQDMKADKIK